MTLITALARYKPEGELERERERERERGALHSQRPKAQHRASATCKRTGEAHSMQAFIDKTRQDTTYGKCQVLQGSGSQPRKHAQRKPRVFDSVEICCFDPHL